jgi:hypothetical protein
MVAADRAVRDTRTTESGLRDLRTQSGVLTPRCIGEERAFSPDALLFPCRIANVAWRRQDRKMVVADRAVRDARTTESGL